MTCPHCHGTRLIRSTCTDDYTLNGVQFENCPACEAASPTPMYTPEPAPEWMRRQYFQHMGHWPEELK